MYEHAILYVHTNDSMHMTFDIKNTDQRKNLNNYRFVQYHRMV